MKKVSFSTKKQAKEYQKNFKKKYGYRPALFIFEGTKKKKPFMVIKPSGLQRIDKM